MYSCTACMQTGSQNYCPRAHRSGSDSLTSQIVHKPLRRAWVVRSSKTGAGMSRRRRGHAEDCCSSGRHGRNLRLRILLAYDRHSNGVGKSLHSSRNIDVGRVCHGSGSASRPDSLCLCQRSRATIWSN